MYIKYLLSLYTCLFVIDCTEQNQYILSFKPSSINVVIGENKSVTLRLAGVNLTFPVIVNFVDDDKFNANYTFIDHIPNIVFNQSTSDDQTRDIVIIGRHEGHFVLTAQSTELNGSSTNDSLLLDIARSRILSIFIQIVGWIYFFAWSISFYPQIILNFTRRSVIGLNFDFLALNILGHSCYSVFNLYLYTSHDVQQQYYAEHPHGVLPVLLNDVIFSCHAVLACAVTVVQCLFFERGNQRVSHVARLIGSVLITFLFISTIVSLTNHLSTLSLIYFFSYVKLSITIIKYVPQAYMNYKRKSTEGWSIGNILLDFTGGVLSVLQMFLQAANYKDWSSIFGSPTKFGLGFFSILFDVLFIIQHYVLYRPHKGDHDRSHVQTDETSPILQSKS